MVTIIETLADYIEQTRDPDMLTEYVRQKMSKRITRLYMVDGVLYALVLSPKVESKLSQFIHEGKEDEFLDMLINRIQPKITQEISKFVPYQATPLLLTSSNIRRHIKRVMENYIPQLVVLSYNELDRQINLKVLGVVDED